MKMFNVLLMFFFSSFLVSCVGTVQDSTLPLTKIAAKPKGSIIFDGIISATPISQDKVEIFFYPASGGSSKFYYTFYVGDKPLPYTFPSEILTADYRGFLKVTITGLEPAKTYILKGAAMDQETLDTDSNNVTTPVTTFSNLVADFVGVTSASNTPGIDGIDSINVRWTHARVDYANITGNSVTDPKRYEVIAVDADRLTPGDMDKAQFGGAAGRHVKIADYDPLVNEGVVRGLKSNTRYYVRVRALHASSIDDFNQPELKGEKNTNYLTITTLNSSLANVKNLETLTVNKNPGLAQSSSLLLNWDKITGVFDHLRIYYINSLSLIPLALETGANCQVNTEMAISCRKLPGNSLSTVVANLTAYETYSFILVACQNTECTMNRTGPMVSKKIVPTFAGFSGISSVEIAGSIPEIGKLFLRVPLPDFNQGNFDGYIIGFKTDNGPGYAELSEMNNPPLTISNYNYRTDTTIELTGVNYQLGGLFCFTVYPFVYAADGSKVTQINDVWKCNVPEIKAPDKSQFPGAVETRLDRNNITVKWNAPTAGIFEAYEVYIRKTPGTFSFTQAIAELDTPPHSTTNYERVVLPWFYGEYVFENLAPGAHKVGVRTRYLYGSFSKYQSEINQSIYNCAVTAGPWGSPIFCPGI